MIPIATLSLACRRRVQRRRLAVAGVVTVAGMALLLPASASASEAPTRADAALAVTLPDRIAAGESASAEVTGAADGPVDVLVVGSLGTWSGSVSVDGGTASVDLPAELLEVAGRLTVVARDGDATATAESDVVPGEAVAPVQTVVGARSIVADAADIAMAVVIPVDRFGNAVEAGTPVTITRVTPLGETQVQTVATGGLLAFADVESGVRAGQSELWAQVGGTGGVGGVSGPSATLQEVPGRPAAFTVASAAPGQAGVPGADGRSLTPVQTSVIADAYGNVMPDGTQVELRWSGPAGEGSASAETIAGVASFWLEAPAVAGDVTLTGFVRGLSSGAIAIEFATAVSAVPFTASVGDAGTVLVDIGPVSQVDGRYVADGTPAVVTVTDASGAVTASGSVRLYGGVGTLELVPSGSGGSVSVTVLGATGTEVVR